jgi:hypothetical protein
MSLAEKLQASLRDLLASGSFEISESGGRVTPLPPVSWEVRGAPEKPLLHLWAENCNLTRRVLRITDQSPERMALAVECFGRAQPQRMELLRREFQRSTKKISREDFCEQLCRILAQQFPDEEVEKVSVGADREHSLSGIYARGVSRKGSIRCAFLAVPEGETPDAVESSLTYALLWLERARQSAGRGPISFLRLILPAGTAGSLANRLAALNPQLAIQVCELNYLDEQIQRVDPCANGNVDTRLVPHRESEMLKCRAEGALAPIVAMRRDAISMHANPQEEEVVLRFRGLTFARWRDGQIYFGIGAHSEALSAITENKLKRLISQLQEKRNPLAADPRHSLYRLQAERWMQWLVTSDVSRVDINLDPDHVYEQVFARAGAQHGVLDLLGVTRSKRLAILELKATENPDLPLQAADYWARIRRHQAQGDLARNGYFSGMQLQAAPPIVYLVAPTLHFHATTAAIVSYLSPELKIVRVGLTENWRRGLQVTMRR